MSERRVEICNQLPANHPFQPPTIEPLQMILPNLVAETVVPAFEQVAASEPSATTTVPKHTYTKTSETATTSVPGLTDVVNQPKQPHQPSPNQTTISTPTPIQPENQHSPQKAIPEPVVETVVSESIPAIESEQIVAITVSEPIQTPTQPSSTAITIDQPSSSSSTIQTQQQPPHPQTC